MTQKQTVDTHAVQRGRWQWIAMLVLSFVGLAKLSPTHAQVFLPPERVDMPASLVDWSPMISSDLLELYFTQYVGPNDDDILVVRREHVDDPWGVAESVGDLVNSPSSENTGTLSYDGLTMIFGSQRPGGFGGWDLWISERVDTDREWGEPVNLESINTPRGEATPSLSKDGLTLYFGTVVYPRDPPRDGGKDIWFSTRENANVDWSEPERLNGVNSDFFDSFPSISPDGLAIYFASTRPGSYGNEDIYVAWRDSVDDEFGEPLNLGPAINTPNIDIGPYVASDGSLYLTRNGVRNQVGWELWRAMPTTPLPGDFDLNGAVDVLDIDILREAIGHNRNIVGSDLNKDGLFDSEDVRVWVEDVKQTFFGDADLDGEVSFADFLTLSGNFDESGGWGDGDFDGDGKVAFADFLMLSQNFGNKPSAISATPEPTSALSATIGVACILRLCRRRRCRRKQVVRPCRSNRRAAVSCGRD